MSGNNIQYEYRLMNCDILPSERYSVGVYESVCVKLVLSCVVCGVCLLTGLRRGEERRGDDSALMLCPPCWMLEAILFLISQRERQVSANDSSGLARIGPMTAQLGRKHRNTQSGWEG